MSKLAITGRFANYKYINLILGYTYGSGVIYFASNTEKNKLSLEYEKDIKEACKKKIWRK